MRKHLINRDSAQHPILTLSGLAIQAYEPKGKSKDFFLNLLTINVTLVTFII